MKQYTLIMPSRYGWFCGLAADVYQSGSVFHYGEWAQVETDFLKQFVKPGHVVIDGGANVGNMTVAFARMVGDYGHVIAFEPQRFPWACAIANIAINSLLHVAEAHLVALSDQPGTLKVPAFDIESKNANTGGFSFNDKSEATKFDDVQAITIDSLNLPKLDLLKLDLEGYEVKALRGGIETIRRCQPIIWAEQLDFRTGTREETRAFCKEIGYRAWKIYTPLYTPNNARWNDRNIFADQHDHDILMLPPSVDEPESVKGKEQFA